MRPHIAQVRPFQADFGGNEDGDWYLRGSEQNLDTSALNNPWKVTLVTRMVRLWCEFPQSVPSYQHPPPPILSTSPARTWWWWDLRGRVSCEWSLISAFSAVHSVWRLECEVLIKTLLKASLSFWLLNLMLTQKLHSEALARKRKEEKKRKERKGVCERSCSWARAASGAVVVHSSSSSSWQKQRVLAFAWWGWWTTLQYRQMRRLFSIFHILSNCVRDKWLVNNFTESAWKASFFAKLKL